MPLGCDILGSVCPLLPAGPGFLVPRLAAEPSLAWKTLKPAARDTAKESSGRG